MGSVVFNMGKLLQKEVYILLVYKYCKKASLLCVTQRIMALPKGMIQNVFKQGDLWWKFCSYLQVFL